MAAAELQLPLADGAHRPIFVAPHHAQHVASPVGEVNLDLVFDGQHDGIGGDAGATREHDAGHAIGGDAALALFVGHDKGFVVAVERGAVGVEQNLHKPIS